MTIIVKRRCIEGESKSQNTHTYIGGEILQHIYSIPTNTYHMKNNADIVATKIEKT